MKKSVLIPILIIVVALLVFPVIVSQSMQTNSEQILSELKENGITVNNELTSSSYLSSSAHYDLIITDPVKFLIYLNAATQDTAEPIAVLMDNISFGVDIEYNHLLFGKSVQADIYLSALPIKAVDDDETLKKIKDDLLKRKVFSAEISYEYMSDNYHTVYNNINEKIAVEENVFTITTAGIVCDSKGEMKRPEKALCLMDKVEVTLEESNQGNAILFTTEGNELYVEDIPSKYFSFIKSKKIAFLMNLDGEEMKFDLQDLYADTLLSNSGIKANVTSKNSLKKVNFSKDSMKLSIEDFMYDLKINGLDKDTVAFFQELVQKGSNKPNLEEDVEKAIYTLIEKGFEINIEKFSIKSVEFNQEKADGFNLDANMVLKADADAQQKINTNPKALMGNLETHAEFTLSNTLFELIGKYIPMANMAKMYAKEKENALFYDIKFKDMQLTINDQQL